jgi:MFS family permease
MAHSQNSVLRAAVGAGSRYLQTFAILALVGACGGFFVVPVNAWIQQIPRPKEKGRLIAVANLLSFIGVGLQPVAQFALLRLGHPAPSRVFLIAGVVALGVVAGLAAQNSGLLAAAVDWTRIRRSVTL